MIGLACYGLAVLFEQLDKPVWNLLSSLGVELVSGHDQTQWGFGRGAQCWRGRCAQRAGGRRGTEAGRGERVIGGGAGACCVWSGWPDDAVCRFQLVLRLAEQQLTPRLRGRPIVVAALDERQRVLHRGERCRRKVGIKTGMQVFERAGCARRWRWWTRARASNT